MKYWETLIRKYEEILTLKKISEKMSEILGAFDIYEEIYLDCIQEENHIKYEVGNAVTEEEIKEAKEAIKLARENSDAKSKEIAEILVR